MGLILQVFTWSSGMRKSFEMATTICHVMLCHVSHSSHLNVPQTVWIRRTHWGFSIWGPSPLPDICKALIRHSEINSQIWPPWNQISETNRKKSIQNLWIQLVDLWLVHASTSHLRPYSLRVYIQLRSAHSRFEHIPLQCPCAAVVASKAIEPNQQNRVMVEFGMLSRWYHVELLKCQISQRCSEGFFWPSSPDGWLRKVKPVT